MTSFVPEGSHISQEDRTHKWNNWQSFVIQAEFEASEPGVLAISPPALQSLGTLQKEGWKLETSQILNTQWTLWETEHLAGLL